MVQQWRHCLGCPYWVVKCLSFDPGPLLHIQLPANAHWEAAGKGSSTLVLVAHMGRVSDAVLSFWCQPGLAYPKHHRHLRNEIADERFKNGNLKAYGRNGAICWNLLSASPLLKCHRCMLHILHAKPCFTVEGEFLSWTLESAQGLLEQRMCNIESFSPHLSQLEIFLLKLKTVLLIC